MQSLMSMSIVLNAFNTDSYKSGMNHFFIKEMERVKDVDMTANMSAGLYASTMIEIDALRKDFNQITFDYENESFETLNKLKVVVLRVMLLYISRHHEGELILIRF